MARRASLSTHADRTSVSTKDHINSSLALFRARARFSLSRSRKNRGVVVLFVTLSVVVGAVYNFLASCSSITTASYRQTAE